MDAAPDEAYPGAVAAALLLARADAGILTRAETLPVARTVTTVLGSEKLGKLRALWREAFTVADDNTAAMLDLGRRWCEIIGLEPTTDTAAPSGAPDPSGTPSPPSPLAKSISAVLGNVGRAVAHAAARWRLPSQSPTLPIEPSRPALRSRCSNAHDVYWQPWSECSIVSPATGCQRMMAMPSASRTSSVGYGRPWTSRRFSGKRVEAHD